MRSLYRSPRLWVAATLWLLAALPALAFDLDSVEREARLLAAQPYSAPPVTRQRALADLSYDAYRDIRFKPAASLWRDQNLPFELQFFHVGRGFTQPLQLHEVVAGVSRSLVVPAAAFDYGRNRGLVSASGPAAVAGFRVHAALNNAGYKDELIVFLGASYFRAVGAGQHYGLSARALAIDTVGGAGGEEFPAFRAFWIERPANDAATLTLYALLDGPRVSGAYRFVIRPGTETTVDVEARVFTRIGAGPLVAPITTLGIAPLSSMFLAGENQPQRLRGEPDFRPEIHDSDGLQIAAASGEWLWRPLVNPQRGVFVTSFALDGVRGWGLMQRDRRLASYEDLEAQYERRPSVWIAPQGDAWGAGRVELMQFHTEDETNDNVAAYWVPAHLPPAGEPLRLAWRLQWQGDAWQRPPAAWVAQTRRGRGFETPKEGELQFHIDFHGPVLANLPAGSQPEAVVTLGDNAHLLLSNLSPLSGNEQTGPGWRLSVRLQREDAARAVEARAFLKLGTQVLSETWSLALPAE